MSEIDLLIVNFLDKNGLKGAKRKDLAGDASFRRYERIACQDKSYVLMIAPPDKEDVRPFLEVDELLLQQGLNAPDIIAKDLDNGLLLLEDFGDNLYSKVLQNGADELELYNKAIEVLEKLPAEANLPEYSRQKMLEEVALFTDWYAEDIDKQEYLSLWDGLLGQIDNSQKILVLRDYHADNLLWLPEREGLNKVGLLDFQDAVMGHLAYDYVSLLEDARRDVSPKIVQEILKNKSPEFMRDYYILGAQRNLKIIGIFNRLKKRDGKDNYSQYLPRVWAHLNGDLQHEVLQELKEFLTKENVILNNVIP